MAETIDKKENMAFDSGAGERKAQQERAAAGLKEAIGRTDGKPEELLWEVLELFQKELFYTAKGLEFTYTIKGGEMFVSRKDKSITKATVLIAFDKAMELGGVVTGPKKLGTFGASYLYPIFRRIGIISDIDKKPSLDYDKKEV